MPDNCVTTQKKLSLACETTAEPAPIETTTIALAKSLSKPRPAIMGASMDAAVISATVDEPWAVLMAAASRNGILEGFLQAGGNSGVLENVAERAPCARYQQDGSAAGERLADPAPG
jgi:hypothetical protein